MLLQIIRIPPCPIYFFFIDKIYAHAIPVYYYILLFYLSIIII